MKRARAVVQQVLCRASELSPATLTSGQAFRWAQQDGGVWRSPLGSVVFSLSWTEDEQVVFAVDPPGAMSEEAARAKLRDYFRLDSDLATMTREWQARDPQFVATPGAAVRQLRQEPFECLMSFICSQNNNVKRIGAMIEKLCTGYGSPIGDRFAFPTIAQLAVATEEQLRDLGFGYRAPYIVNCVRHLQEKPDGYLLSLRDKPLAECRTELTALKGVGLKVADCVALFSLDKSEVVPVDTHVWQIARDKYKLKECSGNKTLTPKVYVTVSKWLSDLWGPNAGWAHSLLFDAKLKAKRTKKEPETKRHKN